MKASDKMFKQLGRVRRPVSFAGSCLLVVVLSLSCHAINLVVPSGELTRFEKTAQDELRAYLVKATGEKVEVVREDAATGGGHSIYLGRTRFAAANGIDCAALNDEEWVLREIGGHLVVAGGDVGTMFAAYRFLEDVVGVHWLDPTDDGEYVPPRRPLDWKGLDRRGQPKLRYRHAYLVPDMSGHRYLARNRATTGRKLYGGVSPAHTIYTALGKPDEIRRLFKAHPDWFPLIDGKRYCHLERADGAAQSEFCFTNPELTAYWIKKLREWIVKDRAAEAAAGRKPPMYYAIDQNDCYDGFCQCEACAAIAKREESNAGIMLDFVNRVAAALGPEFPDVRFQMMALHSTEKPPKLMKTRPNVSIRLCDTTSNVLLPWTAPANAKHLDNLKEWARHANGIGMWDYSITYGSPIVMNYPTPTERTFAADLRQLRDCKGEGVFFEHEQPVGADMRDLKVWVEFKLAEDPDLDGDALIRMFTDLYYGETAGAAIRRYRLMLEKKALDAAARVSWFPGLSDYMFIDRDAFVQAYRCRDEAMAAVRGDAVKSARVEHAFLSLDRLYVVRAQALARARAHDASFPPLPDQADVIARYRRVFLHEMTRRGYGESISAKDKNIDDFLALVAARRDLPVPAMFKDLPSGALSMYSITQANVYHGMCVYVDDPSSPAGRAMTMDIGRARPMPKAYLSSYVWPLPCTLWPTMAGTLRGEMSADPSIADGRYHWCKCFADVKLTQTSSFRLVNGWHVPLEGAVSDNSELGQKYDIWASVKIKGLDRPPEAGFLPDSCVIWIDQVAVVRKTVNAQTK